MQQLTVLSLVVAGLLHAAAGHYGHGYHPSQAVASAGDPCEPNRPDVCGESILVSVETRPAGASYGPNVCQREEMYQSNTLTYHWQQYCRWSWGYRRYCWLSCVSTGECNGEMTTFPKTHTSCCEGYASRPSSEESAYYFWHHRHRESSLRSEGCPMMVMENVVDCINHLNLTEFSQLIEGTAFETVLELNMTDPSFTVFALTDEAVEAASLSGLTLGEREDLLATHIVEDTIPDSKLYHGAVLTPLDNETLLHITDVYEYTGMWWFRWKSSETSFINGAEIVEKDACQATNGIVHVVDSVIPSSPESIADILGADSEFGTFKELLDAAGISDYLNRSNPRTVFAPTDAAFDEFGSGISECLQEEENRRALKYLLLIHVTYPVEYTSSLSLRQHIPTFSGYFLRVQDINDTVHITRNEIPLERADIPARNGVIHSINKLIIPPCLDLATLCPPPSAPSPTPTPTSLPPPLIFPNVDAGENEEQPDLEDLSPDEMPPAVVGAGDV